MTEIPFLNLAPAYIEIGRASLRAFRDGKGVEIPIEYENGRLTGPCKEKATRGLRDFLQRKSWQPRVRAICAIGASGVALRRVALPAAAAGEEFHRLLLMQVEAEFPLAPDEMAWGWQRVGGADPAAPRQEILVAAVRKLVLEEFAGILSAAGMAPVFTVAALARSEVCPRALGSGAVLDIHRRHAELLVCENGIAGTLRVFPWGAEELAKSDGALDSLAHEIASVSSGRTLYVTGADTRGRDWSAALGRRIGPVTECQWIESPPGDGQSAAIVGLKKLADANSGFPPLVLHLKQRPATAVFRWSDPGARKLLKVAAGLAAALLVLPYAEALMVKPFLRSALNTAMAQTNRLAMIDREMGFLQFLKQNQPPYLDALYLFAKAAPPGSRIDSLSMNHNGEVSLRGSIQNSQEVTDFRSKLIESGFFETVTVEEQAPTPDRQKLNVRITAAWKPAGKRIPVMPTADEIEKAKSAKAKAPGGPGGTGPPPGFPMPGPMMN